MTATPEQDEIPFPDRLFQRIHAVSEIELAHRGAKKYEDYIFRTMDKELLTAAWDADHYVFDILHTSGDDLFPRTRWFKSTALAKKR